MGKYAAAFTMKDVWNWIIALVIVAVIAGCVLIICNVVAVDDLEQRVSLLEKARAMAVINDILKEPSGDLPEETLPLSLHPIGKDYVIVSVVPEYKDWLLAELNANKGVRRIFTNRDVIKCYLGSAKGPFL